MKKLVGKTDIEDALKRLDKLTNEEVRMVTAQVLEGTQNVNDRVGVVENRVVSIDDRVAGVDDRVAHIDETLAGVDDNVKAVDDKVTMVIDGAQPPSISHQENRFDSYAFRGKRDKGTHTTSVRQHGSSRTLVIIFLR